MEKQRKGFRVNRMKKNKLGLPAQIVISLILGIVVGLALLLY